MKQGTARKLLGLLLALAMVIGLLPGMFLTALAEAASVSYVDARGKDMGTRDCLPVTQSTTTLNNAWYVVNGEVVFETTRLEVTGDVNLILADGCLLDAQYGIHVQKDARLTIWAQSTGGSMGELDAVNAQENNWDAAIGGNQNGSNTAYTGSVTIHGGKILADGGPGAFLERGVGGPGIFANDVTINGGDIKEKMVGEADPALTYLAEGLVAGDLLEGQLTREAGEAVGAYFISAEAIQPADYCKANYTVVGQGSALTILAREFGTPDFTMPGELAEIMESAFEGLGNMKVVDAHGCAAIGKDAFKDTGLARIRLPKDCEIDPEAFGNRKIYVFAPAGGTTEAYCAGHDNLVFIAE